MRTENFVRQNSILRFFPFEIFAISQIECARDQNQSTSVNIFSRNFKEENKSKNCADQQFQISIRRNGGNIYQAKSFENKILNKVTAESQKEKHHQLKWGRGYPNLACTWKRNNTCDECEIEQHRDATFFCSYHLFYKNILQCEEESGANRNAIKKVEMKIIVSCPTCDKRQSNESNQRYDPPKFRYVFSKKNFGKHQRKQWNRPENYDDLSQRQFNYGINVEEETYGAKDSAYNVQKKLIGFKRGFAVSNYERQQGDQSEKKSKKSHLKSVEPLPHKFRDNVVSAADEHLAEKKRDSLPISIQGHKFSETRSRPLITFMV